MIDREIEESIDKVNSGWTSYELDELVKKCEEVSNPSGEATFFRAFVEAIKSQKSTLDEIYELMVHTGVITNDTCIWEDIRKPLYDDFEKMPLYINSGYSPVRIIATYRLKRGY